MTPTLSFTISLLFPAGTIFHQEIFTCVWWFDFDCNTAESLYSLNDALYEEPSDPASGGGQGGQRRGGQSQPATKGGQKSGQSRAATSGGRKAGGVRGRPSPATVTAVLEFPQSEDSNPLPLYGSPGGRRGRGEGEGEGEVENPFYDYN